ncbi:phytanoyl-CoA dioxygenase family protein, partial [Methylibium sp. T29]|uniref:phytanoyl-CoA dioxygenase family protein n=1 Tax=Methylibium sp. T29 TaxID=1430884 RepID=UPI00055F3982
MQLSTDQLARYRRDGFIVLPELLAPAEVAAMKAELQRLQGIDTDHLVRERVGGVAKTIYRVHEADGPTASPPFHAAARAPRLLAPARQLLGDESLYVYHVDAD